MNKFLNGLNNETNYTYTENGALTHTSTGTMLLDMFALGAAMRKRSDEDVILLFKNAYEENPEYALKCLFYIGDILEGQGERRFFRICYNWLAKTDIAAAKRNMKLIPRYRRWDDLYALIDTPLEDAMFNFMKEQLALDVQSKTPSLLAKWLKSENTSSKESCALGKKTREAFGMTPKQYRKTLSILRSRINIVEKLMSENRWEDIEYDKIPSRAGMIYKNAFARHDIERAKKKPEAQTYAEFAKDETKKVNAKALYPYECVAEVINKAYYSRLCGISETERAIINKYWDNLTDYFQNSTFNGMALVDTSGSMHRHNQAAAPLNVAISLGLYCAEKAKGPFANHFISFESTPHFIKTEGVDFVDKVLRIARAPWAGSTDIEAAFDLMLNTALKNNCSQSEIPQNLIIISDMEFDTARGVYHYERSPYSTLMESIESKWNAAGYKMPNLVYWNVDARQNNIPMTVKDGVSFVSGMSPSIFQQIMSGKTAFDLMYEVLNKERYKDIY